MIITLNYIILSKMFTKRCFKAMILANLALIIGTSCLEDKLTINNSNTDTLTSISDIELIAHNNIDTSLYNNRKFSINGVSFNMIAVQGGSFFMGCQNTDSSKSNYLNEKDIFKYEVKPYPVHKVILSSYWIGETELTQGLWQAVMGKESMGYNYPCIYHSKNHPANRLDFNVVLSFLNELNKKLHVNGQLKENENFRLPTEAEWEYAAKGGKKSKGYLYSGSNNIDSVAWIYDNISYSSNYKKHMQPVAKKKSNELGIFDMTGNVSEICWNGCDKYNDETAVNPYNNKIQARLGATALRGGSYENFSPKPYIFRRNWTNPARYDESIGCRLLLSNDSIIQKGPQWYK